MLGAFFRRLFGSRNQRLLRQYGKVVDRVNTLSAAMADLSDEALAHKTDAFRERLREGETLDQILPEAFAVVREVSDRVLGLRHYDVQLLGGIILHHGKISEMRTGEGKTLMSTLPIYLNALPGKGVHVVTVNDYLGERDANWMRPIYEFLGLSVGINLPSMTVDEKRTAYAADITYGTNNEFGFDYLRDNMAYSKEQRVQRELVYAVIDEVDSILIDEARTPLIISGQAEESSDLYQKIDRIIPKLTLQAEEDGPGDYSLDEKTKQAFLTEEGHETVERLLREAGLLSEEGSLYDLSNIALMHYVTAALRAHGLFQCDVDYIVKDNQIMIVDEHTGRLMEGRRWSDGLHQAVEAKEGVDIQLENVTLASITFQNFFRLYEKLSGMTGTADTEAFEFQKIYNLEVVVLPTHRPMARIDSADRVYLTEKAKYKAIVEEIKQRHATGQPVLVGTPSIEASEHVAQLLRHANIKHHILNAKQHEQEAYIVAQAGRPSAVTIATNMAGRGTDIVLGGNVQAAMQASGKTYDDKARQELMDKQQEAQAQVLSTGGLHVLGTERNESRRIDNQLRGRSGRQGDPGSSQFYLSLEDNLLRIFAAGMITSLVQRLGFTEEDVIEHSMLSRSIEKAQRRVEGMNFDVRKQLLEYDDVANDQRKVIYEQRLKLLEAESIQESVQNITEDVAHELVDEYIPVDSMLEQWDLPGLTQKLQQDFMVDIDLSAHMDAHGNLSAKEITPLILDLLRARLKVREELFGEEAMRGLEKQVMLQTIDQHWRDHLASMDHLRQGIHLRGYAQKNPAQEYKRESFELFTQMMRALKIELIALLCRVEVASPEQMEAMAAEKQARDAALHYQHQEVGQLTTPAAADAVIKDNDAAVQREPKVGRNEPCPCGSGKKYKHCHGRLTS